MLTDDELQAIADEHVRAQLPEWAADKWAELDRPARAYFLYRQRDWVGKLPFEIDSDEPRYIGPHGYLGYRNRDGATCLVGSTGFLVHREDGTIEELGSGLVAPAMLRLGYSLWAPPPDWARLVKEMLEVKRIFETGSSEFPKCILANSEELQLLAQQFHD